MDAYTITYCNANDIYIVYIYSTLVHNKLAKISRYIKSAHADIEMVTFNNKKVAQYTKYKSQHLFYYS